MPGDARISDEERDRLISVFFPLAYARIKKKRDEANPRFVYYTSADTAVRVIKNAEIWMRSPTTMNDFNEINHGADLLYGCLNNRAGNRLQDALDPLHSKVASHAIHIFREHLLMVYQRTFITCVSEHLGHEDQHGRLSMWRAYGGKSGVALVLKGSAMLGESDVLGAYSSPVEYLERDEFNRHFDEIVANIEREKDLISRLSRDEVVGFLLRMFHGAVLCTKHKGFREEREWRIYAAPYYYPQHKLDCDVEVVRGTPQEVMKLPLRDMPEHDYHDVSLNKLLDRIIVGPCDFPVVTRDAFVRLLEDAGIDDAKSKVTISGIPLRHF